jgi:penicillin-binding protein 1B
LTRNRPLFRLVVTLLLVTLLLLAAVTGWYAWRVRTELSGQPWRHPNTLLAHDGSTVLEFYGEEWRSTEPVFLEELPEHVPYAFLAAEDVRFRRHPGIDPWGVGRAAVMNVRQGGVSQGGSTITQQLAKTKFLSAERTMRRKALEAIVALVIEAQLSKDEILEVYLNDVYLGHHDGRAIRGVDEAAVVYFGKKPEDLTIAEAALIAGIVRAPNRDLSGEAEAAKRRRDAIIEVMFDQGWISEEERTEATGSAVRFKRASRGYPSHRYALAALRTELLGRIGARRIRGGGLTVHTTLDLEMQKAAESAVGDRVNRLRSRYRWLRGEESLQAAILSLDTKTGGIRALVGGTDYAESQFDRTRLMRRQPGSAVKPFAYAAAIAARKITPATLLSDRPVEIHLARNDVWTPHNYDEQFRGDVTAREALEKSLNVPLVRVTEEVGVRRVRSVLRDARLAEDFSGTPAIALGVDEVTMRDLAGAYTVFPNLGRRSEPHLVSRVESRSGRTIYRQRARQRRVLKPEVAYVVHSMLRGVVQQGTAASLKGQGLGHLAGKTGTTNDYRDAWFIGYSPDLVTATWVGFDSGAPLRVSSAEAALPVWAAYMTKVEHEKREIAAPRGVTLVAIERSSGLLWQSGCGTSIEEAFLSGTEPETLCQPSRRRRPEPVLAEYQEPAVISLDKLREWMEEAPGVEDVEIVIESVEDAPPGSQPGDIIIEYPDVEGDEPADLPREPVPTSPPSDQTRGERDEDRREREQERAEREREREQERRERERERAEEKRERRQDRPPDAGRARSADDS